MPPSPSSQPDALRGHPLLRAVVEATAVAIFVKDHDGRYTLVNRHMASLWHRAPDEIVGRTDFDLFPEEVAAELRANDLRVLEAGETIETEERVEFEGRRGIYLSSKVPLRDDDGRIFGLCGVAFDITHLREAEQALRESEERFRTMADSAPVLIWMSGPDKGGEFFNETWLRFRGRALEEELGCAWLEGIHPDDRPALDECEQAFEERRRFRTQFRLLRHDGEYRWMLDTGVPRYAPDGSFAGFIGSCIDVSDRIRMEKTLREQAEALSEADRRKDEFLAMLGHELRNPMAPLRHVVELFRARAGDLDDELRHGLTVAERQLDQMRRLVDDLLDVARLTRGQMRLEKRPMSLARAVAAAVETVEGTAERRGVRLDVSPPAAELRVEGDETRLTQVLANLLDNAVKYTGAGGRVSVRAEGDDRWATVEVRDEGIGMEPEVLSRAFEIFYQGEPTLERTEGGLGVGLTLARRLVDLHGGELTAESAGHGAGSVLRVRLPRLAGEPSAAGSDTGAETAEAPPATPGDHDGGASGRRVLIVDDNRDSADSLGTLLELVGHRVEIVYDGESGLEAAERFDPDVVLLDIGLPRLDGYEVARRLRRDHRGLLIVAITGYGQESARERAAEAGFDHHMLKPVDLPALRRLLAEGTGA